MTTERVGVKGRRRFRALLLSILALIVVQVIVLVTRSGPSTTSVRIGNVRNFAEGSVKELRLHAVFVSPFPKYSVTPQGNTVNVGAIGRTTPVPVFVVVDPNHGPRVFLARDPQSGCHLRLASGIVDATFAKQARSLKATFADFCHGDLFSYNGDLLAGPSPRALDQFGVFVDASGRVIVNLLDFRQGGIDPTVALRRTDRPLPTLRAGESCPVTPGNYLDLDEPHRWTFGPGPAYPDLAVDGYGTNTYHYDGLPPDSGWRQLKTLWAIRPDEKGPVLIRGARLDGPGGIGFATDSNGPDTIRLASGTILGREELFTTSANVTNDGWRGFPGATYVRSPGCYVFRVDGNDFGYDLVFRVAP